VNPLPATPLAGPGRPAPAPSTVSMHGSPHPTSPSTAEGPLRPGAASAAQANGAEAFARVMRSLPPADLGVPYPDEEPTAAEAAASGLSVWPGWPGPELGALAPHLPWAAGLRAAPPGAPGPAPAPVTAGLLPLPSGAVPPQVASPPRLAPPLHQAPPPQQGATPQLAPTSQAAPPAQLPDTPATGGGPLLAALAPAAGTTTTPDAAAFVPAAPDVSLLRSRDGQGLLAALGERIRFQATAALETATVRLDPPSWGQVEIRIRQDSQGLHVTLQASHPDVGRQLAAMVETLRQELQQRQPGEALVSVSLRDAATGSGARGEQGRSHGGEETPAPIGQALASLDNLGGTRYASKEPVA
jgi:flagellar hook-length control protein FliK